VSAWRILIPVKELPTAKSRIGLGADARRELVLAMLSDVCAAVRGAPGVEEILVCSSDRDVTHGFPREMRFPTSGRGGLNSDLNEVLVALSNGKSPRPTAVVVADLPCLSEKEFGALLRLALREETAFVSSLDGGTTILAALDAERLSFRFGEHSAGFHRRCYHDASGQVGIGCRLDVDTLEALMFGQRVGLGSRTQQIANSLGDLRQLAGRGLRTPQAFGVG
jgi:2-phospho-L-lactate guanylyltransferase